jgi:hypothetical protein
VLASCGGDDSSDSTDAGAGSVETFGEEASPGDSAAATRAVREFVRARADGDWAKACSVLAASVAQAIAEFASSSPQLKDADCPELVEAVTADTPTKTLMEAERIRVTGVRIEADRGALLYRDARGKESVFPLLREDSAWKAGALAGSSLP